ncbi:unnamed protein product [Scytosiphon promiscuus]
MPSLKANEVVWQDREVKFDSAPREMECRKGEVVIDSINSVEDTKGNNGERGSLVVTNLRVLWMSHKVSRVNLSIGFNTVINISIRKARSRLRGSTQALCITSKHGQCRFEFVFTNLVKNSPRLFTTVQAVLRAYETSTLYRDLKLRGSIIKDKELIALPLEQIYSKIEGVWNLSSDQGNLGSFFLTNVRLVWHANLAQNFNVSIPYMQMASCARSGKRRAGKSIRVRESKFGQALVVETSSHSGGYILGFRLDPAEKLERVHKELSSLHQVHAADPILGVDFEEEESPPAMETRTVVANDDNFEVLDTDAEGTDAFAAYFAEANKACDREVVFDAELGLAVESLPGGASTKSLWKLV